MSGVWELNKIRGKNPIHTGQFLNSYDSRTFTQEEVLARESAQNSIDAGNEIEGVTELEFHELETSGQNKSELLNLFKFKEILQPRINIFRQNEKTEPFALNVERFLNDKKITALLIRDFNTCGLGGAWLEYDRQKDHFTRLVCASSLDDKADENTNSGGSFGLGKTAYAKNSKIHTVLYHSTFASSKRTNNISRRLMVSGVYPRHTLEGVDYGGFAYFGKEDPQKPKDAIPFEDTEAREIWEKVTSLFDLNEDITSRRDENERFGTDILIFMSDDVQLSKIKSAIEDYYFPALIEKKINVKFFDSDQELIYPQHQESKRKDLAQFIHLIKEAENKSEEKSDTKEIAELKTYEEHQIGKIAFEATNAELKQEHPEKNNCVAMMRGTGMIINYIKLGSDQFESAVGAFIADKNIWKYLVASENPAHSEWNEHSTRLQSQFPNIGKKIVHHLNQTVKKHFREFQRSLQPDIPTNRSKGGLLARLLSKPLSGNPGSTGVDPGSPNPASLSLKKTEREENISKWRLRITPNEHTPTDEFPLTIYPSISLSGDSKRVAIKHMKISIKDSEDNNILTEGPKPSLEFKFHNKKDLDFLIELNDPGRKNFIVRCKCVALKETPE